MDITVCVCTHNRPDTLADCLSGLRRQSVDQFNILVVDSASTNVVAARLVSMVAAIPNARLLRVEQPGLSIARNSGARVAAADYIAYIDDDAIPAPDWIERIRQVIANAQPSPALIGGRILPRWKAPLPHWWPSRLRGALSIIEHEGQGEYRSAALPAGLEPYGANMVVQLVPMLALGGFGEHSGRNGRTLLSDAEVQLACRLQAAGHSVRYDSRIVVHHQIPAARLTPAWLLSRLYWQGVSTVLTRRLLGQPVSVWRELPRRILVAVLMAPCALLPRSSTRLVSLRWRLAYALGFILAALAPNHIR